MEHMLSLSTSCTICLEERDIAIPQKMQLATDNYSEEIAVLFLNVFTRFRFMCLLVCCLFVSCVFICVSWFTGFVVGCPLCAIRKDASQHKSICPCFVLFHIICFCFYMISNHFVTTLCIWSKFSRIESTSCSCSWVVEWWSGGVVEYRWLSSFGFWLGNR